MPRKTPISKAGGTTPTGKPRYTAAQVRFILILRHAATNRDCWAHIAASFNDAFGASITVPGARLQWQRVKERGTQSRIQANDFYEYLRQHKTIHPSYQAEYDDVVKRYGLTERPRRNKRVKYRQDEMRFIIMLEHVSSKAYHCTKGDRWFAISKCFDEFFVGHASLSDNCARAQWQRSQVENGLLFRSLKAGAILPEEFVQEFIEMVLLYEAKKDKYFVHGIKRSASSSSGVRIGDPLKDARRCSTDEEKRFLVLMKHFTTKTWSCITECFNQEFGKKCTKKMLTFQWNKSHSSQPIFKMLRDQSYLSEELTQELECLLNKYGDQQTYDEPLD
ncbi:MAG: hypothetical protein M1812_006897 [Candelaria pacifica]|nr:MAG: hypothetical protein M1812_006897 [Candelaria pacifica]